MKAMLLAGTTYRCRDCAFQSMFIHRADLHEQAEGHDVFEEPDADVG